MTETWNLPHEFDFEVVERRRAVKTKREEGFVHARQIWPGGSLRTFRINFERASAGMITRLWELWTATRGSVLKFNFTPPGESAVLVRFSKEGLAVTRINAVKFRARVELLEVK